MEAQMAAMEAMDTDEAAIDNSEHRTPHHRHRCWHGRPDGHCFPTGSARYQSAGHHGGLQWLVAAMGRCDEYHKANQVFWTDIPVAFSPLYNPDTQLNLNEPNGLPDPTLLTGRRATSSVSLSVYPSTSDHLVGCTLANWRTPFGVTRRWTSLGQMEGEADPQLRGYSGFKIQHPNWQSVALLRSRHQWSSCSQLGPLLWYLNDNDFIPASCDSDRAAVLTKLVTTLPTADGEEPSDLRYWDESAMVLCVQMIRNGGKEEAAVCTEWDKKRFSVMLEAGNNASVSGGQYSCLLENLDKKPSSAWQEIWLSSR